jgi:hypothetical protein
MRQYCAEKNLCLNKHNFLGKGLWSKVYRVSEDEVIILSSDPAKECLAIFCQDVKYLPKLTCLENVNDVACYLSPFYYPLKASNKKAWGQYKAVKQCLEAVSFQEREKYKCFEGFKNALYCLDIDPEIIEAINTLLDNMANYTDHVFLELSPRNVKVDGNGELILLDIIGDTNELNKKRGRI